MAALFGWAQTNGVASAKVTTALGISGNLFNFKKRDDAIAANYSTYPVTAGQKSYEVWLRAKFTGVFNRVDNVQFWRSTNFSPATGLATNWAPSTPSAYATPVSGTNKAVSGVPSADPGTANVRCRGGLTSGLVASGYTDYIVLQLATTSAAPAGDTSLAIFTMNYDES
jgi:hypothetical protein